ncbi:MULTISPECIES: hypothetical protein [Sphingobium]|uniref:Uncharacterized protein n=1 Tax=Sphingobium yanoikuyae ATCC 51230 TaxID=883163 RepID=K9D513_SPHYA|nr:MULTISPECIES: hypothetical protein [Sphingobium]EKU74042.1 hypothetical protein HMPREF9718_03371 [Sphingobium yanoikuyae ATCC 51230]WQE07699.1 hypothetical protein U0025_02135 [Sphingobium yanoikuyae]SHM36266.1 hypothetical protein SAMN05518668_108141 [Sphingobium sp. YR657]
MSRHRHAAALALILTGWLIATATMPVPRAEGTMRPPSTPDSAIRSEFRVTEKHGTRDAYILFAQRHPNHPLASEALRRADKAKQHPNM